MKKLIVACLIGALGLSVTAKTLTWTATSAAGHWFEASNWAENAAPETGDTVVIPKGMTAVANDADMTVVKILTNIQFADQGAVMRFDLNEDHETDCFINASGSVSVQCGRIGEIVKNGTGKLWLQNNVDLFGYNTFITVNDGILRLPQVPNSCRNQFYKAIVVNAPGVLWVVTSDGEGYHQAFTRAALGGDGLVTNITDLAVSWYLNDVRQPDGQPYAFSGKIGGDIRFTSESDTVQYFTGSGSPLNKSLDCGKPKTLYGFREMPQSIVQKYVNVRYDTTLLYLGEGGDAPVWIDDDGFQNVTTIDGGAKGGLRLCGDITFDVYDMNRLVLTGANANECVLDCPVNHKAKGAVYMTKKGPGTWYFKSQRNTRGVLAVEDGVVKYDTLREAGYASSLGRSGQLAADRTNAVADATFVPYAFLLGTTSTTGTLEYVGSDISHAARRPIAIKGTGCLSSTGTGKLGLLGVTAVTNGLHTLVLDGTSTQCTLDDVADGTTGGTLAVRKVGSGTWDLGGELNFTGGLDVREGTVRIHAGRQKFDWFRFVIKERDRTEEGVSKDYVIDLGEWGLFDADGNDLIYCVHDGSSPYTVTDGIDDRNSLANMGRAFALQPGEATVDPLRVDDFDASLINWNQNNGWPLCSVFDYQTGWFMRLYDNHYSTSDDKLHYPWRDRPQSWISVVVRLKEDANEVKSYDIGSRWATHATGYKDPSCWALEGSSDGLKWFTLDEQENVRGSALQQWIKGGGAYDNYTAKHTTGWPIASSGTYACFTNGLERVSVSEGATLEAVRGEDDAPVEIKSLKFTSGMKGGTLKNFAFAENGAIEVVGDAAHLKAQTIPLSMSATEDWVNIGSWTVSYNGKTLPQVSVSVSDNGVTLLPPGAMIIVR